MGSTDEVIVLSEEEVRALYRILKPCETDWTRIELNLLSRLEGHLYRRMTIEEIEDLKKRGSEESP